MTMNKENTTQHEKIIKGLELAYQRLIEFKIRKKSPLVVSKNGKVVELNPLEATPTTKYKWH